MHEISKTFEWDMGHRITQHRSKCYNLHGHRYKAEVFLSNSLNEMGMVLDYYELSKAVDPIIEEMDHAFMLYDLDKVLTNHDSLFRLGGELDNKPFKSYVVPFESTAENIAKHLFERIKKALPNVRRVIIWETPKCKAVYEVWDLPLDETTEKMLKELGIKK